MYSNQQSNQSEPHRRHSFNNKVLVGGDNGKTNHKDQNHMNLIQINSRNNFDEPHSAPILPPMSNPFDNMPVGLKNFNFKNAPPNFQREFEEPKEENSNDSAYEDDQRTRGMEPPINSSPDFEFNDSEWLVQRPYNNQRFPRNWGPRTNFRPPFGPQMWPRNGPRPPNRWMGPRPQRFW